MKATQRGATLTISMLALTLAAGAYAQSTPLITKAIDENKLVTLAGNTRPEATAENDRGRVDDKMQLDHILLLLKRSPEQEAAAAKMIDSLHEPSSPNYHKWMTAEQWGQKFGLAKQDHDTISRWLASHGITVNTVYKSGMMMDITGTAGQIHEAFHTEIHNLLVDGKQHIANISDPLIPEALAPAVMGPVSLNDFRPEPQFKRKEYTGSCFSGQTCYDMTPGDLAVIYGMTPLFKNKKTGQKQTIALMEEADFYKQSDWVTFRKTFGLNRFKSGNLKTIHPQPSGSKNCKDPGVINGGESFETAVDVEYSAASAPDATIEVASCADSRTTAGLIIAMVNLLNAKPPSIFSISYGGCEASWGQSGNAAFSTMYQQGVAEGVSIFVSSGDNGAAGCAPNNYKTAIFGTGVSAFASTPYNVAVGGTDFYDTLLGQNSTYWKATNSKYDESAISYIPEIPWNDSCASQLLVAFENYPAAYGSNGLCNDPKFSFSLSLASGSGGPSTCATGAASISGVTSGTCAGWPKPSWQALVGVPSDGVRDLPDVSLFASNGWWGHYYPLCYTNPGDSGSCTGAPENWSGAGGTSFAAPIMAGIQALVDQVHGRQGNPNPVYYKLAANEYGASGSAACNSNMGNKISRTCTFHDITSGDMDTPCQPGKGNALYNCYLPSGKVGVLSTSNSSYEPAYGTNVGWDFATGIGSVNAARLVTNWKTVAP